MARTVKQLTDTEIKKARALEKDYKLSDGKGLYFVIKKNGTKFFRFDFTFGGRRKTMSFGIYPEVTLKEARRKREEARANIDKNINPINAKRKEKLEEILTLEFVYKKWVESISSKLSETTLYNYKKTLEKNVLSDLGSIDIKNIRRLDIVALLNKMIKEKQSSSAKRIFNLLGRIFSYAVVTYELNSNVVDFKLTDILKNDEVKNHTAIINKDEIKDLMEKIKSLSVEDKSYFHYSPVYAIKILPYIFVRISSFLASKWSHIDFEAKTWLFPKENMKTKKDYIYPIPSQVINLLLELKEQTKIKSEYVFHSAQNRPQLNLSRATVSSYLKKELGFTGKMTLHGFRSTFSTTAYENEHEHGYNGIIIESCLSHQDNNKVRAAYNRESKMKYFNQKKELIQWYCNWLDTL